MEKEGVQDEVCVDSALNKESLQKEAYWITLWYLMHPF